MKTFFFFLIIAFNVQEAKAFELRYSSTDTSRPLPSQKFLANEAIDSNLLIVVDGIQIGTVRELKSVDHLAYPTKITGIVVLRDSTAIKKYGEKGKYGCIRSQL